MKLNRLLTLCLLAAGLTVARAQQVQLNVPGQAAPAAAPAFSESQIVEEFGWFIGKRVGLTELDFSAPEIAAFLKGVSAAAAGKESPYTLEKIGPLMDEFMQKKQTAYLGKLKQKNMADNLAFFTKLKENKAIVELPSGLRYEILKAGEGANPKASDTVKVHYTGTLIDGTV
jgi:FKBP-type peptidyl-prolyl cis-trans isomerase